MSRLSRPWRRRFGLAAGAAFALAGLLALRAAAQEAPGRGLALEDLPVVAAEGREFVVLPSPHGGALAAGQAPGGPRGWPDSGGLSARSYETSSRRVHVVTFEGRTYRAATPLAGPRSWIVFEPARRAFVPLSPSLRVELGEGARLDELAKALDATRVTSFDSLGFAIVHLPGGLHPVDALARARGLPGQPEVALRLRGRKIEWR